MNSAKPEKTPEPEEPYERVGSLCTGIGGLDLAVRAGASLSAVKQLVWVAETDPAASRLLRERFPGVPNHGDLRSIDYAAVAPVDLLTMGVPCQPVSLARRAGRLGEDDERWLWPQARRALHALRPARVLFENVRGLTSIDDGKLWKQILADFRSDGYQVTWGCVGACALGAPHHRHRVFAWAQRCGAEEEPGEAQERQLGECGAPTAAGGAKLLPTPVARDGASRSEASPAYWVEREAREGKKSSPPLPVVVRDLPADSWGEYGPVIAQWEREIRRAVPARWVAGKHGGRQLAPAVPEWMMGLPAGWVTNVPGLTFPDMRRLIGNGVCIQQAAYAYRALSRPEFEEPKPAYVPPPKPREPRQEEKANWGVVYSARLPQPVVNDLERMAKLLGTRPGTVMRQVMTKVFAQREHLAGPHAPGEEIYACWGCEDWRNLVKLLGGPEPEAELD